jgi:hypothetical protein
MLSIGNRPLTAEERRACRWIQPCGPIVGGLVLGLVYPVILGVVAVPVAAMGTVVALLLFSDWRALWIVPICVSGLLALALIIATPMAAIACVRLQRERWQALHEGFAKVVEGSGEWAWLVHGPKDKHRRHPQCVYLAEPGTLVVVPVDSLIKQAGSGPITKVPASFRVELLPKSKKVLSVVFAGLTVPAFDIRRAKSPEYAGWLCLTAGGDVIRRANLEPDFHVAFERPDEEL